MEVHVTADWQTVFPGAAVGVLAMADVENPAEHPALAQYVEA